MSGKKRVGAAPEGLRFRVLRGLNYRNGDAETRIDAGEIVAAADLPKHGSGQCEDGCSIQGEHDWLLTGGDPVLVPDDAAWSDAGRAPAEE